MSYALCHAPVWPDNPRAAQQRIYVQGEPAPAMAPRPRVGVPPTRQTPPTRLPRGQGRPSPGRLGRSLAECNAAISRDGGSREIGALNQPPPVVEAIELPVINSQDDSVSVHLRHTNDYRRKSRSLLGAHP